MLQGLPTAGPDPPTQGTPPGAGAPGPTAAGATGSPPLLRQSGLPKGVLTPTQIASYVEGSDIYARARTAHAAQAVRSRASSMRQLDPLREGALTQTSTLNSAACPSSSARSWGARPIPQAPPSVQAASSSRDRSPLPAPPPTSRLSSHGSRPAATASVREDASGALLQPPALIVWDMQGTCGERLEAVIRSGRTVAAYIYADSNPINMQLAAARVRDIRRRNSASFLPSGTTVVFGHSLPANAEEALRAIRAVQVPAATTGALPHQHLVFGPGPQDPTGEAAAKTLHSVLSELITSQPRPTIVYIGEPDSAIDGGSPSRWNLSKSLVRVEAARCGSLLAERPSYNIGGIRLETHARLQAILDTIEPSNRSSVADILFPGAELAPDWELAPALPQRAPDPPLCATAFHSRLLPRAWVHPAPGRVVLGTPAACIRDTRDGPLREPDFFVEIACAKGLDISAGLELARLQTDAARHIIGRAFSAATNVHALSTVLTAMTALAYDTPTVAASSALGGGGSSLAHAAGAKPSEHKKAPEKSVSGTLAPLTRTHAVQEQVHSKRASSPRISPFDLLWLLLTVAMVVPLVLVGGNYTAAPGSVAAVSRAGTSSNVMAAAHASAASLPTPPPLPEAHNRPPQRATDHTSTGLSGQPAPATPSSAAATTAAAASAATPPPHGRPPDPASATAPATASAKADKKTPPPNNGTNVPGYPDFRWDVNPALPKEVHDKFISMLNAHRHCFAFSLGELGTFTPWEFDIELSDPGDQRRNLFTQQYRSQPVKEREIISEQCADLERNGLIEPSSQAQYASPTVLPPKKDASGDWTQRRMCGDYRKINAATVPDKYPMPTADGIFDAVAGATIFSTFDLFKGYNQLGVAPKSRPITAFWGGPTLYQWKKMPFGLKNAGACFQRAVNFAIRGLHAHTSMYIDDGLTYRAAHSISQKLEHVDDCAATLDAMDAVNMRFHPGKCHFGYEQVDFLGHVISKQGVAPQQSKIEAVQSIPVPRNPSDIKSFLGLAGYYRRFVPGFSTIARPLTILTSPNTAWCWEAEQQNAFETLKAALTSPEFLVSPDFSKPFLLQTDWSCKGMGAILAQRDAKGHERVIAYASKTCTPAESRYSSYKGELLAVVWGVKHYHRYLAGHEFTIVTDHQPLKWLTTSHELTGQYARWAALLQEYNYTVIHRPGLENPNADALSRTPNPAHAEDADPEFEFSDTLPPYPSAEPTQADVAAQQLRLAAGGYKLVGMCVTEPLPPTEPPPALVLAQSASPTIFSFEPAERLAVAVVMSLLLAAATDDSVQDIWQDGPTLHYVQHGTLPANVSTEERNRISHRATRYRWDSVLSKLHRVLADGGSREVPPLADRPAIVLQAHNKYGHWGIRRTYALLSPFYWWHSMWSDSAEAVRRCAVCDRSKASYNVRPAELSPLPIQGPGYRWHVDLAGPLPPTPQGHVYVLIAVDAFTKWVEAVPIPDKSSATTADAFLFHVLSRQGACAEVVSDQGKEFSGDFEELLVNCGIDHRMTSHDYPQANGQAERMVQTIKAALRRMADEALHTWAAQLPWLLMGYRMTPHARTLLAPYVLLHGQYPVLPPATAERLRQPIDYDDPTAAVRSLIEKAALVRRLLPQALDNLLIGQHMDTQRYAQVRSGGYRPQVARLFVGDYVYLRPPGLQGTLELGATPDILRLVENRPNGVAILQGKDTRTVPENVANLSVCRLPGIDGTLDPSLAPWRADTELPCERCNLITTGAPNWMIICDGCLTGWHMKCLTPPLKKLPPADVPFLCPYCKDLGRGVLTRPTFVSQVATTYDTRDDLAQTLDALMPGPWSKSHITRIFRLLPGQPRFAAAVNGMPQRVPTLLAEYDPLLDNITWARVRSVLDPWSGNGTTAQLFRLCPSTRHVSVTLSDIDPQAEAVHSCGNALDISYLRYLAASVAQHAFDVVVSSPLFALLDLAIPVLYELATAAVFVHVPGHYLVNMPPARRAWFKRHAADCCVFGNLPVGPMGRRCAWVCLFKSPAARRDLLRLDAASKAVAFYL